MRLIPSILAAPLLAASVHAAPLPAAAFAEFDQFSNPSLSPDGKHIAVNVRIQRGERSVPILTVYALPDLKIVSQLGLPGFELMANYHWVSNTRLVGDKALELGLREKPEVTGEIIGFDLDGKHFEYLYGYKMFKSSSKGERYLNDYGWAGVNHIPAALNGHVYVNAYLWEGNSSTVIDINSQNATRKMLTVLPERCFSFVLEDDGTPRFAHGVDDNDEDVLYRADASGEWKRQPADLARSFYPFRISRDNSLVYAWRSEQGGPTKLVSYALDKGTITTLADADSSNIGSIDWAPGVRGVPIDWRPATGKPDITYLNPADPDAQLHKMLASQFAGEDLRFVSSSQDGQKLVFWVGSDRDPGSYYLFDRHSGKADLLFSNFAQIDPEQMAERRPIRYQARDGVTIEGYLTLPANPEHKRLPMIVLPHGGPIGIRDYWHFDSEAQFLASRGYAVLQPNFRGSDGRGEAFQRAGYLQWSGAMMDDIIDGVKWTIAQGLADPARICTFGASFGGYAALELPIREPSMFKCAVGYSGRYDVSLKYDEGNVKGEKAAQAFLRRMIGNDPEELKRISPAHNAGKIRIPVMLVHGGKDKICSPAQYEAMRDALAAAGNQPELIFEPDEGHGFYDPQRRINLFNKLEAFFARHLGK